MMDRPEYTITYRQPDKRPVERIQFIGPLHTVLEALLSKHTASARVSIGWLDCPSDNHFDAEACRAAAEFFNRLATILDNEGYETKGN